MVNLTVQAEEFGQLWHNLLAQLCKERPQSQPRGMKTRERLSVQLILNKPLENILLNSHRNLSYRFMVAEWLWIWFGHDDVATIARYNPNIAQFSDNGIDFNGAYGKAIKPHWDRIVSCLTADPDSRQAVISIYKAPSAPTKDTPCTLTVQWLIRNSQLYTIVNMRSSDIWLGLPYDVFNFTMLTNILSAQLKLTLGTYVMNLGSSHLYEKDYDSAKIAMKEKSKTLCSPTIFEPLLLNSSVILERSLMKQRKSFNDAKALVYPWSGYHEVLHAKTNKKALKFLYDIIKHTSVKR